MCYKGEIVFFLYVSIRGGGLLCHGSVVEKNLTNVAFIAYNIRRLCSQFPK